MSALENLIILFVAANPDKTIQLRLDEEVRNINRSLRASEYRDRFELRSQWAVRYGDLQELLLRYKPHIVHFSGHGSDTGEIALMDGTGATHPVPPKALTSMFAVLKDNIRCVVLSACYSEPQARSIARFIDCVIGIPRAITDDVAIRFASGFYLGIGQGLSIKTAFDLGCSHIALVGASNEEMPTLIASHVNPETIVLLGAAGSEDTIRGDLEVGGKPYNLTKLSGTQLSRLQNVLLSAFTYDTLRMMVKSELDQNLDAIVGGSNLSATVFNLIDWAQRTGRLDLLLNGASQTCPNNPDLNAFVASLSK